ncbi:hypothetical protein GAYE_SCF26G4624 [Galdieria yellowstonensis]|uniref:Secreted protein n=1 Tax=Galdieria yellowstonensis TaxID=3028027 RepID=A0AAV9IHH1_9RHOD|nr:hypothetical protein GAYE_SCF26G4624 [Galdieria yellowstonensis]
MVESRRLLCHLFWCLSGFSRYCICREELEKWSCPFTCLPLIAVFACRDCKFSVVEKLNRYIWLTKVYGKITALLSQKNLQN